MNTLPLFPAETPPVPSDPLIGLAVHLPHDPCFCGTAVAEIGAGRGPHSASLRCVVCDAHRGWLSRTTHQFLTEIINKFGRPETPIVIGRGPSFAAQAAKTHDGSPPAPCASPDGGRTKD